MDTEDDYVVAKEIVRSGMSSVDWETLRNGKGDYPEKFLKWQNWRAFSFEDLKNLMKEYKQTQPGIFPV
jgi:hypothetical protein